MQAVKLSKANVFKGSTNRNVPGACATLALKRLLERLIQFAEKVKKWKKHFNAIMERQNLT